jgi:hypothetical protein
MPSPRVCVAAILLACFVIVVASPASAQSWTTWTTSLGGEVQGVIIDGSNTILVTYSGEISLLELNGVGVNFYLPTSTFTGGGVVNPPPSGNMIAIFGTPSVHTLTFSTPVTNPIMAIVSLGTPFTTISYNFSAPFNILNQGSEIPWGGGPTDLSNVGGTVLQGTEGDGIIQFPGTFNSISWTVTGSEYWNGFTVGIPRSTCQVTVPPPDGTTGKWYQLDPAWANDPYDHTNPPKNTIGGPGCALTALAACMAFVGSSYDPEALNVVLDGIAGAYSLPQFKNGKPVPNSGGRIAFPTAVTGASGGSLWFDQSKNISSYSIIPGQPSPVLDSYLCGPSPKPVMVQVYNPRTRHKHYVVVTGKDSLGNYSIIDPGYLPMPVNSLSTYGNQFEVAGVVKKANGDPSALDFTVVDTATLLVTAPDGSKTGFDPVSGQVLKGLPQSAYFAQDNSIDTDTETVDATSVAYSVDYSFPPDGTYTVQLVGLQSDTYQLTINAFDVNGSHENYIVKSGVATKGSSSSFQVKFSSVPGATTTVTRTATFASTLADIANSVQLGLIETATGGTLEGKIKEAASAVAENESDDAREELYSFKKQVSMEAGTQITGAAPQVLLEDAAFLISQLP